MDGAELRHLMEQVAAPRSRTRRARPGRRPGQAARRARPGAHPAKLVLARRRAGPGGGYRAGRHRLRARLSAAQDRATVWRPEWPATAAATSCRSTNLRVPRAVIHRALQHRRELLSMNFDAGTGDGNYRRAQRGRSGIAQRGVRAAGAHPRRAGRRHQPAHHRRRNRGRALPGFAPGRGRYGGRQSRAAADAGDRSLHRPRKRAPAGGRARQAAHGGGTESRARHPAKPAAARRCPPPAGCARPAAAWLRRRWAATITT